MIRFGWLPIAMLAVSAQPLRLDPANPHYLEFRGKTTVLIGSTEHYGAVLNSAFDYRKYLDTLAAAGLNLTRTFMGLYREVPGSFNIARNTLAPDADQFLTPYAVVSGKYDRTKWNDAFFHRLRDFVSEAGKRGIVVEIVLFCTFYEDQLWNLSPLNDGGGVPRTEALTLKHPELVTLQDAFVRKVVSELRDADNIYYEICNEPYFAGVSLEWQRHIAATIGEAEAALSNKHLIAQNIANNTAVIDSPDPRVSLFNFHYARPPAAVATNYKLNRATGYDETGFDGPYDSTYRVQAWEFLLAGGATFDHLDYSFTAGHEEGAFEFPVSQPGGGSPALRKQLGILGRFLTGFNLARMKPAENVVVLSSPAGATVRALWGSGVGYAIYVHHGKVLEGYRPPYAVETSEHTAELSIAAPQGKYRVRWWNPRTGAVDREETFEHRGGPFVLVSPEYREDVALELRPVRERTQTAEPRP
jgi:hypothetical protein